jgi:putative Mg2+ transporter-C (MgtC) family protein
MHLPTDAELLGRVALAAALGMLVGAEREFWAKPAGMRTHAMVAVGAAAFTVAGYGALASSGALQTRPDVARIAAQVVSGIGFLGAGVIIFQRDKVRGVTTAADIWADAAIGVLCGLGLLLVATGTTALLLLIVAGLRPIERRMILYRKDHHIEDGGGGEPETENPDDRLNGARRVSADGDRAPAVRGDRFGPDR